MRAAIHQFMSYQIHGRAVMDLARASGRTFNRASLIAYVEQHFGRNTRFCTCTAIDLTAGALIDMLTVENGHARGSAHVCHH